MNAPQRHSPVQDFLDSFKKGFEGSFEVSQMAAKMKMYESMSNYYKALEQHKTADEDTFKAVFDAGRNNAGHLPVGKDLAKPVSAQALPEPLSTLRPEPRPQEDNGEFSSRIMGAESGGRRFANDGTLLTSPKGAQGEMQVMPATSRDPGFGVRPAQDDSPDELARVGRDYSAAMLAKYNGDERLAAAAYNAGPGRIDSLRTQFGDAWLDHAPEETRNYVQRVAPQVAAIPDGEDDV